jgi:hypothetical protein
VLELYGMIVAHGNEKRPDLEVWPLLIDVQGLHLQDIRGDNDRRVETLLGCDDALATSAGAATIEEARAVLWLTVLVIVEPVTIPV